MSDASNTVPEGWSYEQLGDYIVDSAAGEWGNEAQGDDNDIPVLRSTNFTKSGVIDYTKLAFRNIEEKKRIKKALKNGDILLEKSGGSPTQPVGRVVYFDRDTPHLYSNFTQKLVPAGTCHSKYLFYKLYFEYQNGTVLKFQQQTTGIINFQLAEYLGFKTTFAPLPEQQKIATILSSVDDVIEKTRAQIDKLKDLKTGMMQELLTKGVCDEQGKRHTEFKDSPVGRIPVGWDVKRLSEACTLIRDGTHLPPKRVLEGVPLLSIRNMQNGRFSLLEDDTYVTKEFYEKMHAKWKPKGGDLLLAVVGATVGKVCQVPCDFPVFTLQRSVAVLRGAAGVLENDFLHLYSQSKPFNESLWDRVNQTAQPGIYLAEIGKILIPLPSIAEQREISNKVKSIDTVIELKRNKVNAMRDTKQALMQDLLTGKVRVNVNKGQKESAVA